jgi:hypothetical protein
VSPTCPRCGSDKVVPDVALDYRVAATRMPLGLRVHGKPDAWIAKDTAEGQLSADVCGACGHVELRVGNAAQLYEKYQQSRGQ